MVLVFFSRKAKEGCSQEVAGRQVTSELWSRIHPLASSRVKHFLFLNYWRSKEEPIGKILLVWCGQNKITFDFGTEKFPGINE